MGKFATDDLVRLITEGGDGIVVRVIVCGQDNMRVEFEDGTQVGSVNQDLYELVIAAEDTTMHEDNMPQVPNVPDRTYAEIHDDIAKMFIQVAQHMRQYTDDKITLTITAESFNTSDDMEVEFKASCRYEDSVVSDNLYRSAELSVRRHSENKELNTLKIPYQRRDEAA